MKAPSKNITESLKGQNPSARGAETMDVQQQRAGGPTMTVPGDGKVDSAPGSDRGQGGRGERSAGKYTEPMSRYGGK